MRAMLTDATWARLDPYTGRLSRRETARGFLVAAAALALVVAGVAVLLSGLVVPRVAAAGGSGYGYDPDAGVFYATVDVTNRGAFPVEVVGVGRDGPGLAPAPLPVAGTVDSGRLDAGEEMAVGVAYRVADCDQVPSEPWPVPVRIARPWGTHTAWIELPTQAPDDLRPADRHTGVRTEVEWQRNLADPVCRHRAGGGSAAGG